MATTLRKLGRAVLLGAATVFASKRPHEHWSTPPTAVAAVDPGSAEAGEGDRSDPTRGDTDREG